MQLMRVCTGSPTLVGLLVILVLSSHLAAAPPNVVFFFIDDLGWSDLGYAGSRFYETPHIDRLAGEGVVFTDAYANAPNCAPSREIGRASCRERV